MVAYGVLELKEIHPASPWLEDKTDPRIVQARFENDQLRKLVNDELRRYGLLLSRVVVPKNSGWRTKANACVLYGQLVGTPGFQRREILAEGSFQQCCQFAAKLLDDMDRAQVPDTATGHD